MIWQNTTGGKMKSSISILLISIISTACSSYISYGKKELMEEDIINKLVVDTTEINEVSDILKEPQQIYFLKDGNELWMYEYVYHSNTKYPIVANLRNRSILYLLFNNSGVLKKKRKALFIEPTESYRKKNSAPNLILKSNQSIIDNHSDDHNEHMWIHKEHHDNAIKIHKQHIELHNSNIK